MLVLLGVALLIGFFGERPPPCGRRIKSDAIKNESIPESVALGKFLFDVKGQRLRLGNEVIGLTDKECRILELFNDNFQ